MCLLPQTWEMPPTAEGVVWQLPISALQIHLYCKITSYSFHFPLLLSLRKELNWILKQKNHWKESWILALLQATCVFVWIQIMLHVYVNLVVNILWIHFSDIDVFCVCKRMYNLSQCHQLIVKQSQSSRQRLSASRVEHQHTENMITKQFRNRV